MLTSHEAAMSAQLDAQEIAEHVRSDLAHNEDLQNREITHIYHYLVCGTHIDPDAGKEYVPLDEPVNSYRRRKISKRNSKVRQLVDWVIRSLTDGQSPTDVQAQLEARQSFSAVCLALSWSELETLLAELYATDYCIPGSLDGGYFHLVGQNAILYGWKEALPCEGGVTDRYCAAELARVHGK